MTFTAAQIAQQLHGEVIGDGSIQLTGFAPANTARAGDLTFAENESFLARAEQSAAAAILVDGKLSSTKKVLIRVPNARVAFAGALALFYPEPVFPAAVHPTAIIAPSAQIHPTAYIGPYCVIGEQTTIGARVVLEGANHLGDHCQLAEEVHLFPYVTVYPRSQIGRRVRIHSGTVIGSDGYGYVLDEGQHRKIPQVGYVIVHDDVEIGANVTVDRGTLGPTVIGKGTKIDNLVQIAHNVVVGEHCLLIAQVGIAGSTKLGNFVTLAGQVGVAGHLKLGDRVTVAAQSGVMNDIGEGEKWLGAPARPDRQMKRQLIAWQQLPDFLRRVQELERQLARLSEPPKPTPEPPTPQTMV
jgi:UDP-3-O-[3-hydroxymyristoyl] glucosamine N-acyltransferase